MKKYLKYLILSLIAALTLSCALLAAGCGGKVTLSFDAGEGTPVESITAETGTTVELPLSYRQGYVLAGWSTQEDGTLYSGTVTVPDGDVSYTAVWAEGYEISFDADGGVYAEGAPSLTLAAGADLYNAVKDIKPTKSGLDFGAWFSGDTEITAGYKMPAENISLTAKYKVEYAIESYLLNLAGNSYVRSADVLYASDYVGTTVSPAAPQKAGFTPTSTPAGQSPVPSARLDADASKNVLKFYYDRLSYELIFSANAPAATGSVQRMEALYESPVILPENGFTCAGRRFAGWSLFSGGDVDFRVGETMPLMGDTVLYAVWDVGFTDRYGGQDLVFFPRLEPEKAILLRGNKEFEGTRTGDEFFFHPAAGDLNGKVFGSMFCYKREDLAGKYTFVELVDGEKFTPRYEADRTIEIDNYLNAENKRGNHTCKGSVRYSEDTLDYVFESSDETFRFLPMQGGDYEYSRTFLVGGDEVGSYLDFVMVDPLTGMGYTQSSMMIILDGYGVAMLGDISTAMSYDGRYYVEGIYMIGSVEVYKIVCFFTDTEGLLTGTEGAVVTNFVYTIPIDDPEHEGYVQADEFRGEYAGENGETLVLDGFGPFEDSFKYTAGGTTYKGRYSVTTDLMSGSVANGSTEDGKEFSFRLDAEKMTFSEPKSLVEGDYLEYRFMDGSSLRPPFLILHSMNGAGTEGKVNVYIPSEDESSLIEAANGTFTAERIGNSTHFLYTFTRTKVTPGYENAVGEQLVFYNTTVSSTVSHMSYTIYCLLESTSGGNKTSYWDKYAVTDGGEIWVCNSVSTGGLGSLYIEKDGTVTEGEFTLGKNTHFDGSIGTFLHATEQGELVSLYFDLSKDDAGKNLATPRADVEQMLYVIQPTGLAGGIGTQMIFLDGVSRMKYTEDNGVSFLDGEYSPAGTTCFDETIYSFKVGGTERFRFVAYTLPEYGDTLLATKYDSSFETELSDDLNGLVFRGTGSLTIDGYHSARFDRGDGHTLEGDYFRDALFQHITFTAKNGAEYLLELNLEERSYLKMDWAAGRSWTLLDNNFSPIQNNVALFTDNVSEKVVSIRNSAGNEISKGTYVVLDSFNETWGHEEYLLRNVSLGEGYPRSNYRVTFATGGGSDGEQNACLVFNPEADGLFTDDSWNVLFLDGYGLGTYATSDYSGNGSYEVIDFEKNFISFTIDDPYSVIDGEEFYFRLDPETGALFETDYEKFAGVFFADDFESLSFGDNGTAYLGSQNGPYYVENGKAYVYLTDTPTEVSTPDGKEYVYNGKTYHRWDGEPFSLEGKVVMLDKDGHSSEEYPELTATLSFTPNGTTNRNLAAVFTFAGNDYLEDGKPKQYTGYTLSLYASGDSLMGNTAGTFSPTIGYGRNSYPVSFAYSGGKYTFTVTAGYNRVEYLDHNARYEPDISVPRGGRLYKSYFGFGAIEYESPTLSGDFLYLYKAGDPVYEKPLHFENVAEESAQVVGHVPGYGDRLEITFRASDGNEYLLNYYEYYQGGNYFWCYGLFSYQDVETEKYTVRVKTLLYTKMSIAPGYFDAQNGTGQAIGKISAVTLLDKETGKPVVAYDTGITPNGYDHSVWIVDKADVVEHGTTNTCTWGTGYLVTFTLSDDGRVSAADVKTYRFAQVVNYMQHLVNLFFDEEGNTVLASVLVYNGEFGRYEFTSMPHDLVKNEDGTFSFYASWSGKEYHYTVKVDEGEDVTFKNEEGETVKVPGYTVTVTVSTMAE